MEQSSRKEEFISQIRQHLKKIYGEETLTENLTRLEKLIGKYKLHPADPVSVHDLWTHEDHVLITYADMVKPGMGEDVSKLCKQDQFLREYLNDTVSCVHILPFFPSSSDDGFSVVDYRRVDEQLGGWEDIESMSRNFRLMGDLVMNHASRHSEWFQGYLNKEEPYEEYFIEVDPDEDLSSVVRPRSSPLLTPIHTKKGEKFVWTTFSEDQIDLNFANPDVLFEFLDIFFLYLEKGISIIRLDAVAFIWKKPGTSSIHLDETHEIIKLFRTLTDYYRPDVTLITETNVPHQENISYFGEGDEAHMVYQFSLPPLLLHGILSECSTHLTRWVASLDQLPDNCTYFNFTASHDGIGVRPLEGLIPREDLDLLVHAIKTKGGFVSEKKNSDGSLSPYELNITYFDAFKSNDGSISVQEKRFICSQIIALSLKGVPGIYFHNFTATKNNIEEVSVTGRYRTINRMKWEYDELVEKLEIRDSSAHRVFYEMKRIIAIRKQHAAFHPFGRQKVYDIGPDLFCLLRRDPVKSEFVLVLANLTGKSKTFDLGDQGLPLEKSKTYTDLLSEEEFLREGRGELGAFQATWIVV